MIPCAWIKKDNRVSYTVSSRNGLCGEDAGGAHVEDVGQEVGQGNDNDCLAEEGKEDGVVLLAQGFKGGLAAMLEDHENKGRKVEVEAGQGGLLQDRVGAEDAQQEHGKKAHDAPDDDAVAKAHDEHDLARIEDIVHAAGAVVVAHDG